MAMILWILAVALNGAGMGINLYGWIELRRRDSAVLAIGNAVMLIVLMLIAPGH